MTAVLDDISTEILDLKKRIGATILAHYYQEGEIQALADITGDSLKLAREATKVDSPVIVFCGVLFMAETAKMLNPAKRVLLPDLKAGCSLVDACPADRLARHQEKLRLNGHRFQTICYINSSAKVKALSDWVVTSGNAVEVVRTHAYGFSQNVERRRLLGSLEGATSLGHRSGILVDECRSFGPATLARAEARLLCVLGRIVKGNVLAQCLSCRAGGEAIDRRLITDAVRMP